MCVCVCVARARVHACVRAGGRGTLNSDLLLGTADDH